MASDYHSHKNLHSNASRQGWQDTQTIERSVLTSNSYLEEAGLTTENKIKLEDVHTSGRWYEEDRNEELKVKKDHS